MKNHHARVRLLHLLAGSAMLLGLLVTAAQLYGATLEQPYLRYTNLPFPALAPVHAGEALQLNVERCNDDRVEHAYLLSHQLVNLDTSAVVLLPDTVVAIAPGCQRAISRVNVVPPGTAPGHYMVTGVALARGLFALHRVAWQSVPFEVLSPRGQP